MSLQPELKAIKKTLNVGFLAVGVISLLFSLYKFLKICSFAKSSTGGKVIFSFKVLLFPGAVYAILLGASIVLILLGTLAKCKSK